MAIPRIRLGRRSFIAASLLCLTLSLFFPFSGATHEPITTNVRFNKEIIRILEKSCLDCHSAGKIRGDISLTTYEEARPWAKAIKEEVLEKRMPPYQAVKGFGSFIRDYGLSQREIDLLVSWVEGGAPKGDAKDLPPGRREESAWALGRPDLVLTPPKESKLSADEDSTTCIVLNTNLREDRWISGIEFKAGNQAVVHSASISLTPPTKASGGTDRFCPSGSVSPKAEVLGSWVPGQSVARLPAGMARLLPRGSKVILRIKYQGNGEPAVDLSSIGLFLSPEPPEKLVTGLLLAAPITTLAPANAAVRVSTSHVLLAPAEAVGLRPTLFPFAKSVEVTAYRPDATREVLVWVKDRRYSWSPAYLFKKPVPLPEGTRIEVVAYLDNSAENPNNPHDPPQAIRFSDTLCEVFLSQSVPGKMASAAGRD